MKRYKYTGTFKASTGHVYQLTVSCNGFLQAFFLLTAEAINTGKHYQLHNIADERGNVAYVDDIIKANDLLHIQ